VLYVSSVALTVLYSSRLIYFLTVRKAPNFTYNVTLDGGLRSSLAIVRLWGLALTSGGALRGCLFSTPSFLIVPQEVKEFVFSLILILIISRGVSFHLKEGRGQKSWAAPLWGLPFFSTPLITLFNFWVANFSRKSVDLVSTFEEGGAKLFSPPSVLRGGLKLGRPLYLINLGSTLLILLVIVLY
jgi:hypothetical protein